MLDEIEWNYAALAIVFSALLLWLPLYGNVPFFNFEGSGGFEIKWYTKLIISVAGPILFYFVTMAVAER